jgi:hypothetical protein
MRVALVRAKAGLPPLTPKAVDEPVYTTQSESFLMPF